MSSTESLDAVADSDVPINLVALIVGERVLTLDAAPNGSPGLPATEAWPDLSQIADACGVAAVTPIGPPRRVGEPDGVIHVVTTDEPSSSAGTTWAPLDGSSTVAIPDSVLDAIVTTIAERQGRRPWPTGRPDWFRPGWLDAADAWIGDRLGESGLRRLGPTTLQQQWSLSAILRVAVDGREPGAGAWFKATCNWFCAEPSITATLNTFAPRSVPTVLAVHRQRPWMLMDQIPGAHLDDRGELAAAAATAIAELQLEAIDHLDALAAAGCPDRTLGPTMESLHQHIHHSIELPKLTADERRTAIDMEPWIIDHLIELFDCGIPSSIVHGDLHLGNVAGDVRQAVLYDWTDASFSHPFLDGVLLARSAGPDRDGAVQEAFVGPWRTAFPQADVGRAWELAVLGNRVFQAISYEAIYRSQEVASRWEMAGVVAEGLRRLGAEFRAGSR